MALAAAWVARAPAPLGTWLEEPAAPGPAALAASLRIGRTAALLAAFGLLLAFRAGRERPPVAATLLLVALGALDLVAVGRTVNPLAPAELVAHRPPLVDRLAPHAEATRVHTQTLPGCGRLTGGKEGWEPSWRAALASVDSLRPPSGARWGLFGSFDGQFTGLEPRWFLPFLPAAVRLSGSPDGLRLLQLANVGHVLRLGPGVVPGLELLESQAGVQACPQQVLRVPEPLPRVYVGAAERQAPRDGDGLAGLLDPAFDPRREVLLASARAGAGAAGSAGSARVSSRSADSVEVEADLARPGVLVLVEAWDPGWEVRVDGQAATVLRANVLFRGVRLPGGRHVVRFRYRPWTAKLGLLLGVAGAAAAAALALLGGRGRVR
jgi:hypothetical protein